VIDRLDTSILSIGTGSRSEQPHAALLGDIGQHLVKEPTEPNGTPRYSCDIANRP
jgi:hypothetical protein